MVPFEVNDIFVRPLFRLYHLSLIPFGSLILTVKTGGFSSKSASEAGESIKTIGGPLVAHILIQLDDIFPKLFLARTR